MELADIGMMAVLGMLAALIVVDLVKPTRAFEPVKRWRLKGLFFTFLLFVVGGIGPMLLVELLPDVSLLPGNKLSLVGGTLVGILGFELVTYWAHRLHHRVNFLWRWVHQMHHSAERMDIFGAAYFHPFEMIESVVLTTLVCGPILGLSPQAAGLVGVWLAFNGFFQHGNIKTPRWLGYFIQRPEQHGVHHERGVHTFNYANLPLWDMLFGTFRNPAEWNAPCGFYLGSSKQMSAMLLGRDISYDQPARTRNAEAELAPRATARA